MPIKYKCPECGKSFSIKEEYIGKRAKCSCGARFIVPDTKNLKTSKQDTDKKFQPARPVPAIVPVPPPAKRSRLTWILGTIAAVGIAATIGVASGMYVAGLEKKELKNRISHLQETQQRLIAELSSVEIASRTEAKGQNPDSKPAARWDSRGRFSNFTPDEPATASRNTQTKKTSLRIPDKSNSRIQQQPARNAYTEKSTQNEPSQTESQKTDLIKFVDAERTYDILVSTGSGPFGIPRFKKQKAPSDSYYYIVESRINTLAWPKENIEFNKIDGVNIKSTDIILEATDGKQYHPIFASYGLTDIATKRIGFAPGPLRNVALVFGQGAVDGKPAGIMQIYIARPGPSPDTVATNEGGVIDPDRESFRVFFAFSLPVGTYANSVRLVGK